MRETVNLNEAETSLWPFVVYFIAVLVLVATMLGLSHVLGQRRANKATNVPFESGALSVGSPQIHMAVEFYLIAIFFVIFDLETVFIFAWAVAFFELGCQVSLLSLRLSSFWASLWSTNCAQARLTGV